jgi:hypothetical protein
MGVGRAAGSCRAAQRPEADLGAAGYRRIYLARCLRWPSPKSIRGRSHVTNRRAETSLGRSTMSSFTQQ